MDLTAFLAYFKRNDIPREETETRLADLRALERWLQKRGLSLDDAPIRSIRAYLRRLIRKNENSIDALLSLYLYYEFSSRTDLTLYLGQIVNHGQEIDEILARVSTLRGHELAAQIGRDVPQLPLGADPSRFPAFAARFIRRLLRSLREDEVRRVLDDFNECLLPISFEQERALYASADSLDDYLLASARLNALKYRAQQRRNSKWSKLFFPEEYVDRVVLFQEMLSGVRRGNRIYVTLPPYLPAYYLQADTPEKRRYYACGDPYVRASFLTGKPTISSVWCERCVSRCRRRYEDLLGRPLSAEIVECALLGDTACRIAVTLERDAAP